MNTKKLIFYICLLTTASIIKSSEFSLDNLLPRKNTNEKKWSDPQIPSSCLPNPLASKDRTRRLHKLVSAQIQALRNSVIIDYPTLLENKKYKILEGFVRNKAEDLEIPHRKSNYLINFHSNEYHCPWFECRAHRSARPDLASGSQPPRRRRC